MIQLARYGLIAGAAKTVITPDVEGTFLIGPMQSVQVEMGYLMLLKAFAAAVVGGFGSLPGAIVGGIIVGITENLGAAYISASHKDIYAFLLLILVLMFKPSGLFGVVARVKA